jgi:hypothetical protein
VFDSESRSVRLCFGGFDNLTMGNSQGKPVVFTDEGERAPAKGMRWFLSMRFVCGRSWRGAVVSKNFGPILSNSYPQSTSTISASCAS